MVSRSELIYADSMQSPCVSAESQCIMFETGQIKSKVCCGCISVRPQSAEDLLSGLACPGNVTYENTVDMVQDQTAQTGNFLREMTLIQIFCMIS